MILLPLWFICFLLVLIWLHVRHIDHEISKPSEVVVTTKHKITDDELTELRERGFDEIVINVEEAGDDFGYPMRPIDAA